MNNFMYISMMSTCEYARNNLFYTDMLKENER